MSARRVWARFSRAGAPALIGITLVTVVGVSALIGFVGARHDGFDWELAAIVGTALGTTLLAAATAGLAWSTRSEVRATQDLAGVSRDALAATVRPLLLNVPRTWLLLREFAAEDIPYENTLIVPIAGDDLHAVHSHNGPENDYVSVPVRNVGPGVAFITKSWLQAGDDRSIEGEAGNLILPTNEMTRIRFRLPVLETNLDALMERKAYTVLVVYKDLGGHRWETRLEIRWRPKSGAWYVFQVDVRAEGADDDKAITSGPMIEV